MADKKIKRKVVMTVYDDESVEFEFGDISGWHVGKMQRQLNQATRWLKRAHAAERREFLKRRAAEDVVAAEKAAEISASVADAKAIHNKLERAAAAGNKELVEHLKAQLDELLSAEVEQVKEGDENASDPGTDRGDAGSSAEQPESPDVGDAGDAAGRSERAEGDAAVSEPKPAGNSKPARVVPKAGR